MLSLMKASLVMDEASKGTSTSLARSSLQAPVNSATANAGRISFQIIPPQDPSNPPMPKRSSKKPPAGDRLKRSRERNRMHARKTRQRKKEHMQNLQQQAESLKQQQLMLRQAINEKNTASILVGLFAKEDRSPEAADPRVEELLRRDAGQIPDASKVPELPSLILPGQHPSKKTKARTASSLDSAVPPDAMPDDGIDYQLLGKDRSKCSPEELDKIRRERNRMHAKRTRDRKRLFMEEMEDIIKRLDGENELLQKHLVLLGGERIPTPPPVESSGVVVSPSLNPKKAPRHKPCWAEDHIKALLLAAGTCEQKEGQIGGVAAISSATSAVSASTSGSSSLCEVETTEDHPSKKHRLEDGVFSNVPTSITTTSPSAAPSI